MQAKVAYKGMLQDDITAEEVADPQRIKNVLRERYGAEYVEEHGEALEASLTRIGAYNEQEG